MYNHDSIYKKYANTSLDWCISDTLQLYKKNLEENYQLLEENNWINCHFDYKFNSSGFRCEEFSDNATIMFLGCSNTVGIGLPVDAIWCELVAKKLGMCCANLGQGGASSDTAFRLCQGWIDKIRPKIVIFLQPPGIRWELVDQEMIKFFGSWSITHHNRDLHPYMHRYMLDENNNYFNTAKNIYAIEYLCAQKQIKFLKLQHIGKQLDLARDLLHYGRLSHLVFSNQVLDQI
jgi:hypothetical protein